MKPRGFQYMADISSNNGEISVSEYSRAGHVILAIKATQGENYVNPYHKNQADLAHDFGLTVLHYHYAEENSVNKEVANFRRTYREAFRGGDYLFFDCEEGISRIHAESLMTFEEASSNKEPGLYCNRNDWETKYHGIPIKSKKLWIADYSDIPVNVKPYKLFARQYTDGILGPQPHYYAGIGKSDGSVVSFGPAAAFALRKIRTRKRK